MWQQIAREHNHFLQLLAAISGTFEVDDKPQVTPQGFLSEYANPWLRQLVSDIRSLDEFDELAYIPDMLQERPMLLFSVMRSGLTSSVQTFNCCGHGISQRQ